MASVPDQDFDQSKLILEQYSSTQIESTYATALVKVIPQNPTLDVAKFEDIIDNFVTRPSDVFVATYVKVSHE
jgi:hypothetical protein